MSALLHQLPPISHVRSVMPIAEQECLVAQPPGLTKSLWQPLYKRLAEKLPSEYDKYKAADFLQFSLEECKSQADDLPAEPAKLMAWMEANAKRVHAQYQSYLELRKQGGKRRYFSNRAHALYFLRLASPTKLVDGSWLYGLCAYADNPRLSDLVVTYLEELGNGDATKNHVTLYRGLLSRYGLHPVTGLKDDLYQQGLIQLALGWNAHDFMPEIVGFNLAYEQLPLHLLITAYELNELGIDPYYFSLHVTVDNADTGHARRACQAALDAAPRIDDGGVYWQRVRAGAKLGNLGVSTLDIIDSFDIESEVVRIMANKAPQGQGAHSDFCKFSGRSVNDWLANPHEVKVFLGALEQAGWIKKNQSAINSRFWSLLQGDRSEMFGVFSPYELQVIHDWIRGDASADGASFETPLVSEAASTAPRRNLSFRAAERLRVAKGVTPVRSEEFLDADLSIFQERYPTLEANEKRTLLLHAMSPAMHWTPVGLQATRIFST